MVTCPVSVCPLFAGSGAAYSVLALLLTDAGTSCVSVLTCGEREREREYIACISQVESKARLTIVCQWKERRR